jgi:hypothetical protein
MTTPKSTGRMEVVYASLFLVSKTRIDTKHQPVFPCSFYNTSYVRGKAIPMVRQLMVFKYM